MNSNNARINVINTYMNNTHNPNFISSLPKVLLCFIFEYVIDLEDFKNTVL